MIEGIIGKRNNAILNLAISFFVGLSFIIPQLYYSVNKWGYW
jgi:hypothetical protein